jgi:heme A synthase
MSGFIIVTAMNSETPVSETSTSAETAATAEAAATAPSPALHRLARGAALLAFLEATVAGHSLFLAGIVLLALGLLAAAWRRGDRRLRRLASSALAAGAIVLGLDVLGALLPLPPVLLIPREGVAMLFLAALSALAVFAGPGGRGGEGSIDPPAARGLARLALSALVVTYLQILLGTLPRYGAAEADRTVVVTGNVLHTVWAFVVFTVLVLLVSRVVGRHSKVERLLRPAALCLVLLLAEFLLGFLTLASQPGTPGATAPAGEAAPGSYALAASLHQLAGALMFVATVVLFSRALRARR